MVPISISVSAPGKIILHGEHAVVYGKKSIACAIDGNIEVSLFSEENDRIKLLMSNLILKNNNKPVFILKESLQNLYEVCSKQLGNMDTASTKWHQEITKFVLNSCFADETNNKSMIVAITAFIVGYFKTVIEKGLSVQGFSLDVKNNQLPLGSGLGSSAAFNVSVATSLLLYSGQIVPITTGTDVTLDAASLSIVNKIAYEMEKVVHGNPSGIDNSVSTFGGALVYEAGKSTQLPKFPQIHLLVVDSGVTRNTKTLVSSVRKKREQFPEVMECLMNSIHAISNSAEDVFTEMSTLNNKNCKTFMEKIKELIRMNHQLLNIIGVGHTELEGICEIAARFNCASKLTGAGGGGCAIILLDEIVESDLLNLQKELDSHGYKNWKTTLGCEGVRIIKWGETS